MFDPTTMPHRLTLPETPAGQRYKQADDRQCCETCGRWVTEPTSVDQHNDVTGPYCMAIRESFEEALLANGFQGVIPPCLYMQQEAPWEEICDLYEPDAEALSAADGEEPQDGLLDLNRFNGVRPGVDCPVSLGR